MPDTPIPVVDNQTTTETTTETQQPERYCQSGTVGTRGSRICETK